MEDKFNLEDFSQELSDVLRNNNIMKGQIEDIEKVIAKMLDKADSYEDDSEIKQALYYFSFKLADILKEY